MSTETEINIVEEALLFAAKAHLGQEDHGGAPYILHPMRVMLDVKKGGGSPLMQAAALLHDVVEDTDVTLNVIYQEFGLAVGRMVYYLTQEKGQETHREYIERIRLDKEAVVIKLADLRDNMDPDRPTEAFGLQTRYAKSYFRLKFDQGE